jgi:CBS domain-containing protein
MSIESISVGEFMTKEVKTETKDQNIKTACKIMYDNIIGSVVIVKSAQNEEKDKDKGKPAGIITERDVVRAAGSMNPSLLELPIRVNLVTISPRNTLRGTADHATEEYSPANRS